MKFTLDFGVMDGLVFIDESYLSGFDDDMLYAMDVLLDPSGESELVCDFPGEDWDTVRERETKQPREFCGQGKMVIWIIEGECWDCEIVACSGLEHPRQWLHLPTGKLLVVSASELIQCLAYPELEMEKICELSLEAGWYAIQTEGLDKIRYCRTDQPGTACANIQEAVWKNGWKLTDG